jgi:hypothetical protein
MCRKFDLSTGANAVSGMPFIPRGIRRLDAMLIWPFLLFLIYIFLFSFIVVLFIIIGDSEYSAQMGRVPLPYEWAYPYKETYKGLIPH